MERRLTRKNLATLGGMPKGVTAPKLDATRLATGIVHFGIGAFHRAHQAVFTEDASVRAGDLRWGILGVTGRSDRVVRQLAPQDCLYGVLLRDASSAKLRLVGIVRDVVWPEQSSEQVAATLALPTTHLATLTITEKGYCRAPGGGIDTSLPAVRQDVAIIAAELMQRSLARGSPSRTPLGLLVRGLVRRFHAQGGPFSVVSCDNLPSNGSLTRRAVTSLVDAATSDVPASGLRARFQAWLDISVTFPSTMVDRITPATTAPDRALAANLLGLRDDALVVAEPFAQWVIQEDFAGPRPAWEQAGAIMAGDVAPYEHVKLRVLNAAHSMLAYLGLLRGHATIASAVGDSALRAIVTRTLDQDVLPTLVAPAGVDLPRYRDTVLQRFANPALAHTTLQVAMDGSQKLPVRILGTAVDCLAGGHVPTGLALAVAVWIVFVAATGEAGGPNLDDPLAATLHAVIPSRVRLYSDTAAVVRAVMQLAMFPESLRAWGAFADVVVAQIDEVRRLTSSALA